jgi:hypothetical protein
MTKCYVIATTSYIIHTFNANMIIHSRIPETPAQMSVHDLWQPDTVVQEVHRLVTPL